MATGQALIERALLLHNAIGTGETIPATGHLSQATFLALLNAMLDSWNVKRSHIYVVERKTFTLTASLNPHTVGSGADISVARPVMIESASIVEAGIEYPMKPYSRDEYQAIPDKTLETTIPYAYYYEPAFANGNLFLRPVPSSANTLVLYLWTALTTAVTWAGSFTFPPGYERAIVANFAIEVAPMLGRAVSPEMLKVAQESLAWIRSANLPTHYAKPDPSVLTGPGNYNVYTGDYDP